MEQRDTSLRALVTCLSAARAGYREGADLAEHPLLVALFGSLYGLHMRHGMRLLRALPQPAPAEGGGTATQPGASRGAVLRIRAILAGLEDRILPKLIEGEQEILRNYDSALCDAQADPAVCGLLRRQRNELAERIDELHALVPAHGGANAFRNGPVGEGPHHPHRRNWL